MDEQNFNMKESMDLTDNIKNFTHNNNINNDEAKKVINDFKDLVNDKLVFFHPTTLEAIKIHNIQDTDIKHHPYFNYYIVDNIVFVITGFSKLNSSITAALFFSNYSPKMSILSGIAGAYINTGLNLADVVTVKTEYLVDEGHLSEDKLTMFHEENLEIMPENKIDFKVIPNYKIVNSNTVSIIPIYNKLSEMFHEKTGAEIENMEGASFAAAASIFTKDYYQLRAISNYCGKQDQKWDIKNSCKNLKTEINNIVEKYR